jgi:hypothetical protein
VHQLLTTSGQIVSTNDSERIVINEIRRRMSLPVAANGLRLAAYIGWGIEVNVRR